MKFKSIYLSIGLLCLSVLQLNGQAYGYSAFSSSISQGNAYFAALNNPSELINAKTYLSYSISNPYGIKDLHASGFSLQSSNKNFGAGISWQNEGNYAYQINTIGISAALKPIKDLSFGIKGYFERAKFSHYDKTKQSNIDFSLSTQAHPKIKTSFIAKDIINHLKSKDNQNIQNHAIIWSIGYTVEKRIKLLFEIEKSKLEHLHLKTAIAFQKDSIIKINICSSNGGKQLGLGIGLRKKKVELGFAFTAHIILGFSTCLSIAYEIKS